ncbi:Chromodomain-helicase-DNA-binding protein 1-like protein, partial [Ophiophagus hannah]
PVKIIRLIGRDTVEEIIYRRAIAKLQLTNIVIEGGQFALGAHKTRDISGVQKKLHEILKFGLDKLLSSEGSTVCDIDLRSILGETKGGIWSMDPVQSITEINEEHILESHMYIFEGKDYSKETSQGDKKAYDHLLENQKAVLEDLSQGGRILRNKENVLLMTADMGPSKKRKLSAEELEVQQKKIQEAAAKKARLREEKRQRAAEIEQQKKIALWEANHYQSCCLESEESSEEEDEEEEKSQLDLEYTDPEQTSIKYIVGDVTHPIVGDEDAIIVHCVGK